MARKILVLILLIILVLILWFLWDRTGSPFPEKQSEEIITLERKYLPEELTREKGEAALSYHPYLMMDISYPDGGKQHEALLIWGLHHGEIVRDIKSWTLTEGISESIDLDADRTDYEILKTIESEGDKSPLEDFSQNAVIGALRKGLIRKMGNQYVSAVPATYLDLIPKTEVSQPLIKRTYARADKKEMRYSEETLINAAKEIFGDSLNIKDTYVIYLPVYHFDLKKDDQSVEEISFNALTGSQL